MADFEPPSFSLGLDFDFEPSQQQIPPLTHINNPPVNPLENQKQNELEDEDEFQLHVSDSEPDSLENSSATRFRRLRRGGPSNLKPISNSVDDDIEDFTDDEIVRTNDLPAPQHHSSCSSSKLPLSGHGVLMRQQESGLHSKKGKHDSSCPSTSLGSSKGKTLFSDFTASPLRRFQLLDSDSDPDDPSDGVHIDRKSSGVDFPKDNKQKQSSHGSHNVSLMKNTDSLPPISQKQDLWEDFCVGKSCSVQTPAFDEFCEEYFRTIKSSKPAPGSQKGKEILLDQDSGSLVPPSHCYFLHDDLRIQGLVRSRLPYFCPLNTSGDAGFKSHSTSSIDYMSQFGQDGAKQKTSRQATSVKSSIRERKKTKNCSVEDIGSGDWINPKQTTSTPKDAGRRRVHAEGQCAGRWFVAENGTKVYVTKNGKELRGQLAYRHYRKESGKGFKKKSTKKTAARKK